MSQQELQAVVVDVIKQIQSQSGRPVSGVSSGTNPINDLGLDSLNGLECTVELSRRLGFEVVGDLNVFVSPDGKKALRVGEIVRRVDTLLRVRNR